MGEDALANIKKELIDTFSNTMPMMGVNHTIGVLWATIAFEGRPLSMAEISKKTGYSLSTISPHLNTLEMFGKIKRKKIKGVSVFEISTDLEEICTVAMKQLKTKIIQPNMVALEDAEVRLSKIKKTDDVKNTLNVVKSLKGAYVDFLSFFEGYASVLNKSKGGKT